MTFGAEPKDYEVQEYMTGIIANNNIQSVTIVRMEVPCKSGLLLKIVSKFGKY